MVLKANCHARITTTNIKGCWNEWTMWLNHQGFAKIASIPWLEDHGYKIDYHSDREWVVFTPDGKEIIFKQETGKCNHTSYIEMHQHMKAFAMVKTVHKNFEGYTKKEVEKATYAHQAQAIMGHPTDEKFKQLVSLNVINKCPVTMWDIANATALFGPNRASLRGKTVRQKPDRVETEFIHIPDEFMSCTSLLL